MSKRRMSSQQGFTLIELLVVISIIGTLAAIAIPAFVGHRGRAQDTATKEDLRSAAVTLESWSTDSQTYDATVAELIETESSLSSARNLTVEGTKNTYVLSIDSVQGNNGGTFTMSRAANGRISRGCSNPGKGSCHSEADESGNWW